MTKPILQYAKTCCLLPVFIFGSIQLTAQEQPAAKDEPEQSYAQVSLNYITDFVYLGRKDSLRTPYLTPELGYYHKTGFFATASLSYLFRADSSRVDMYTLALGFDRNFTKKINAGAWLEKYFYNSSSTNIRAEIKASTGIYGSYDFGPLETGLNAWYSFAEENDAALGLFFKHGFQTKNEQWTITPQADLNAATQNFYTSYFQNRRLRPRRLPNGTLLPPPTVNLDDATRFRFLSAELSTEIKFTRGKLEASLKPQYIIALNPAVIGIGNRKFTEELNNSFVLEIGVAYSF
ncbi:MAG: hypothetical protein JNM68_01230 [Dinghuibacter sp.]|nr:hypothetical protein [Dinghuibacter sp.]